MELTKEEFSQFTLKGRQRLLDMYGQLVAEKTYIEKSFLVYRMFDFYIIRGSLNADKTVSEIEIISEEIVHELFMQP